MNSLNPIVAAALGSILRWALALGAGYLVKAGIWTSSDAATYVAAGAVALLSLGWGIWNKYHGRVKLLTALTMPPGTTEADVKAHIKTGGSTPAVSTPVNSVPRPGL